MVVHPSFPAKTLAEFIAYAKARPGTVKDAHVHSFVPTSH
jgi:tripartite-type tricarboxylate transporter receptor subunit TctC